MTTLPPLPAENEDPWYAKRNAFDLAVKAELEGRLSEDELAATFNTAGSLTRWYGRLADDPTTAKISFVGDSTTSNAVELFQVLRVYYTLTGMPLAGMPAANIINGGNNGATLASWLADAAGANTDPYSLADLVADNPHLVVLSFGLNDVRLGGTTLAQMIALLVDAVELIRVSLPAADILLRMPNSLTTTVVGTDFVDGITHQAATDILRRAYLSLIGAWPNVTVANTQAQLFGVTARSTSPYMGDELHPSSRGYGVLAHYLARRHLAPNAATSGIGPSLLRFKQHGYVVAAGNGYMDIGLMPASDTFAAVGREWPLTTADTVTIGGYGAFSLADAYWSPQGENVRIFKSGDWTATNGLPIEVSGTHPAEGVQGGRNRITIDPGSVAAGAKLDVTAALSGVSLYQGIIVQPPTAILATGLLWAAMVSADNTITIRLHNPTGTAIDLASNDWLFWVAR
jgi:lysophospholipase L1-like esterase